jgi:predicted protein tyrosine phosphatase
MFKSVKYTGQFEAEEMIPEDNQVMISITDFGPADLHRWDLEKLLKLSFIDVEVLAEYCFTKDQARLIIDDVKKWETGVDEIIVHCFAGVSRSAGVAKWIAEKYNLEFEDEYNDYNKMVYNMLKYEDNNAS